MTSKSHLAVFRADADMQIGGGHVTRCLTIAAALARRGWDCVFATQQSTLSTIPLLARAGHRIIAATGDPAADASIIAKAGDRSVSLLVIDHPTYAAQEERAFRRAAQWRMAIDGRFREHDTEIVLDPNPDHDIARLRTLAAPDCVILAGGEFIPVSPNVADNRSASRTRRAADGYQLNSLLVSLGAGENGQLISTILEGIAAFDRRLAVTVLAAGAVEAANAAASRLDLEAKILGWQNDVAPLLLAADLVIGGGGISAWERCCLGVPSLVISVAENQLAGARFLDARGAAIDCGPAETVTPLAVADALRKLNPRVLARLSGEALSLVDGQGADRIADEVIRLVACAEVP